MIELAQLIKQIDDIIAENTGVSEGYSVLFGDVTLHFHNGWRRAIYGINKTREDKGSTPKSTKGVASECHTDIALPS